MRIVKRVISEQNNLSNMGFVKWGENSQILRLPLGSTNKNDSIRIDVTPSGNIYEVMVYVQSNKKVRSEIKNETIKNIFQKIETILNNKFTQSQKDPSWDVCSGKIDEKKITEIFNTLKDFKNDEKNNMFIV